MGDTEFDDEQLTAAAVAGLRAKAKTEKVKRLCSSLVVEQNGDLISLLAELRELERPRNPREKPSLETEPGLVVVVHSAKAEHNVSSARIEAHADTYPFPHGATATLESKTRPVQIRLTDEEGRSLMLQLLGTSRRTKRWYALRAAGFKPASGRRVGQRTQGKSADRSVEG